MIPYDTEEQLQAILDIIKKHNSAPWFNEFVRLHDKAEYTQLMSGEDLTCVMTATLKPYKTTRNGPTLSKVVLCGNGGGRNCTFHFFDWELRRLNNPGIVAYGFERSMERRMTDEQRVPQERVGGGDCVITTDAYDVRPALFITREVSYAGFKRTADRPYPPPTYTVKTDGCVVGETRFDDLAAAEAYSAEKNRELAEYGEKEKARIAANMEKYKELRAAGKDYYCITTYTIGEGSTRGTLSRVNKWLTDEMAERAKSDDVKVSKGKMITNKHGVMTTEEIDAALADGKDIEICYL